MNINDFNKSNVNTDQLNTQNNFNINKPANINPPTSPNITSIVSFIICPPVLFLSNPVCCYSTLLPFAVSSLFFFPPLISSPFQEMLTSYGGHSLLRRSPPLRRHSGCSCIFTGRSFLKLKINAKKSGLISVNSGFF